MHIYRAIKVMQKKLVQLEAVSNKTSYTHAEISATLAAICCMELVISYGYAVVTRNGPATLEQTNGGPNNWTSADVNEMKKAILKNSKMQA